MTRVTNIGRYHRHPRGFKIPFQTERRFNDLILLSCLDLTWFGSVYFKRDDSQIVLLPVIL